MSKALAKVTKLPVPARTRAQWANAINKSWSVALKAATLAVKAGVETGQYLIEAKADLAHGEFTKMVTEDLAFSTSKANDLMRIAASPNVKHHGGILPTGWTCLRSIASLEEKDFKWAVDHGLVNPGMTRGSALAIKKARNSKETVVQISKGERGPTPDEARKIARATGKMIAASDGRLYTGTTKDEDEQYAQKRGIVYGIKEAVVCIATCELSPQEYVAQSEPHWIHDFAPDTVADAIDWLTGLRSLLVKKRIKVVQ